MFFTSSYSSIILRSPTLFTRAFSSSSSRIFVGASTNPQVMTISATPKIQDGCLTIHDKVVLSGVPSNIAISPASSGSAFVGATSDRAACRHVFTLGVLEKYRFLCLFRFKIWWMIPRFGKSGNDIPIETQMLLLEAKEDSSLRDGTLDPSTENTFYILILPVLDGEFRTSLQGSFTNELQFCVESGDPSVQTTRAMEAVFINSGDNPYQLMRESIKILEKHKGTFHHIDNKKIPANLDWFGWCTWDAFYTKVSPLGIKEGLESLSAGGCPAKFLIIDDGWQDTVNEFQKPNEPRIEGTQFATRLVDYKENEKFRNIEINGRHYDLGEFIHSMKEKYGVKNVYMWHALVGYWGGVLPTSKALKKYNPKIVYPVSSPGNNGNIVDIVMVMLEKYGVGVIDPSKIFEFYDDFHGYLASNGVDGVKVDVQNLVETLGSGYGGRVSFMRQYQGALEESIAKNFKENNLICCMSHNSDYIYSSKKSAVARASEDFMPGEETFQTLHIASVAFNSLLLGEIVIPDWDMFHSKHVTAEFHGAARAIGGCGVYVSDKPGMHDFGILKKLVLSDGSILRARYAGRPTRDCLFEDPVMDGKSLLKIWNLNKLTGVIGVFNCQGAGSWPCRERNQNQLISESKPLLITGHISPVNVEYLDELAGETWTGECAAYAFYSKSLLKLHKKGSTQVALGVLQCEIYTISPIKEYNQGIYFAPIGLIDMYNSGGAVEALNCTSDSSGCMITIKVHGNGRFGAYSSIKPKCCVVHVEVEFEYNDGLLILNLPPYAQSESHFCDLKVVF